MELKVPVPASDPAAENATALLLTVGSMLFYLRSQTVPWDLSSCKAVVGNARENNDMAGGRESWNSARKSKNLPQIPLQLLMQKESFYEFVHRKQKHFK